MPPLAGGSENPVVDRTNLPPWFEKKKKEKEGKGREAIFPTSCTTNSLNAVDKPREE